MRFGKTSCGLHCIAYCIEYSLCCGLLLHVRRYDHYDPKKFRRRRITSNLVFVVGRNNFCFRKGMSDKNNQAAPGDGLRSVRSTSLFKLVNFELYAKPNAVIMGIGLVALAGCAGYIGYMRSKYEGLGYYGAVKDDGTEEFVKKRSKWN